MCDLRNAFGGYISTWKCSGLNPIRLCESWSYVECSGASAVVAISISGARIGGTLPSSIGQLSTLTKLDIIGCLLYTSPSPRD